MIRDSLSSPARRSITTFQTVLWITTLSIGCTLCASSLSFAEELFQFTKDLCVSLKSDLGQNIVPTRNLNRNGRLWLIPA